MFIFSATKYCLTLKQKVLKIWPSSKLLAFGQVSFFMIFFPFLGNCAMYSNIFFSPHETTCLTVASMEEVVYDQTFILIKWFHIIYTLTEFSFGVFKIVQFHGATEYFSIYTWIKIPLQLNSCLKPIQHTVICLTKDYQNASVVLGLTQGKKY